MHLSSIRLSNVRRFAKDVTIDFSPGVTVLLAPNGTGKTAVFEAIELALTGTVARLPESLAPLIRDKQKRAAVKIQFGQLERRVEIGVDRPALVDGSLAEIFGETNSRDLPYLLRLTHLLDQHDRDWFVRADARTAGSHLSKLPVGRDGAHASSVLVGARRYFTDTLNQVTRNLSTLKKELEDWDSLLEHRNESAAELTRPLRPQDSLVQELQSIAASLPAALPPSLPGLEWLARARESLEALASERLSEIGTRLESLASASALVGAFGSERERIVRLEVDRAEMRGIVERLRGAIRLASEEAASLTESARSASEERTRITFQIKLMSELSTARIELSRRSEEVEAAGEQLRAAEGEVTSLREKVVYIEQLSGVHDALRNRQQMLQRYISELNEALDHVALWDLSARALEETVESIEKTQERLALFTTSYHQALAFNAQNERTLAEAKMRLQASASSFDAMKTAVSAVLENLSSDRGDCPVCGTQHGASELQAKVRASLSAIDPLLVQAETERQIASSNLEQSEKVLVAAREALQNEREELSRLHAKRSALSGEIDSVRSLRLINGESADASRADILIKLDQLKSATARTDVELDLAPPLPSESDIASLKASLDGATRQLESARKKAAESNSKLADATRGFALLPHDQVSDVSRDDLLQRKVEFDRAIDQIESKLKANVSGSGQTREQLGDAEASLIAIERQIEEARARQASARVTWTQMQLPGDPSSEIASAVEVGLVSSSGDLVRHRELLKEIGAEIERWRRADSNRKAQSLVDSVRGTDGESERTEKLQKKIGRQSRRAEKLSQVSSAFDSLATSLSMRIDEIQDNVVEIEPRWRSLIKRVVRDQRFANTMLDYDNYYRKQRASVRVPLHDGVVPALSIASEAQLADLQLTFLLSMAVSHRWANWKALLLDDPTQHHDLVHAAAVFDVLRDYVVDHGFQIVIATHDSLQARFLIRKLQNDGVETRLCALTPTDGGVVAKIIAS